MTGASADFFIVNYHTNGTDAPSFFESDWTPGVPEFHYPSETPDESQFASAYKVKAKIKELKADLMIEELLATDAVLNICATLEIPHITRQVEIELKGKKTPEKRYNLFIPTARLSLLDLEHSVFTIDRDKYTGKLKTPEESDVPAIVFESIESFKIKPGIHQHLFLCTDINETVCSAEFKAMFESKALFGLAFTPLDATYKFDPWGEL